MSLIALRVDNIARRQYNLALMLKLKLKLGVKQMGNTRSAKKMAKKIIIRTQRNRALKSRYKTFVKRVEKAVALGDKKVAQDEFRVAQSVMHSTCSKGIYKLNTVSRKIKNLSAKIKAMAGEFIVGGRQA